MNHAIDALTLFADTHPLRFVLAMAGVWTFGGIGMIALVRAFSRAN